MTHQKLHELKDFQSLFEDRRFVAAIAYLREHPKPKRNYSLSDATAIIRSEGAWHGWFEALEELENLAQPPRQPSIIQRGQAYQPPQQS